MTNHIFYWWLTISVGPKYISPNNNVSVTKRQPNTRYWVFSSFLKRYPRATSINTPFRDLAGFKNLHNIDTRTDSNPSFLVGGRQADHRANIHFFDTTNLLYTRLVSTFFHHTDLPRIQTHNLTVRGHHRDHKTQNTPSRYYEIQWFNKARPKFSSYRPHKDSNS